MNPILDRNPRVQWSFWISAGLAVTGGIAPLLLAVGGPNRIGGVAIPFAVAAGAMAVNALMYRQGRPLATLLYFIAGLAIVYGMLFMVSTPLRLAVVGVCPASPAPCPAGLERPFSSGESTGLSVGIAFGVLAILVGFFGLLTLYRVRPKPPNSPSA
jgi:hypothetical protein